MFSFWKLKEKKIKHCYILKCWKDELPGALMALGSSSVVIQNLSLPPPRSCIENKAFHVQSNQMFLGEL